MPELQEPTLATIPEASTKTGISKSAMYELIRTKQIKHVRYKRQIRVKIADVRAWIESQTTDEYEPARKTNTDLKAARKKRTDASSQN